MNLPPVGAKGWWAITVVVCRILKSADWTVHQQALVDLAIFEVSLASPEESYVAWISTGTTVMSEPFSEEIGRNEHAVRGVRVVAGESRLDLTRQGRRYFFVGVEAQDPRLMGLLNGKVLLPGVARPLPLNHPSPASPCQFRGSVPTKGINNDSLACPLDTAQTTFDVWLFILGNHDDRQWSWRVHLYQLRDGSAACASWRAYGAATCFRRRSICFPRTSSVRTAWLGPARGPVGGAVGANLPAHLCRP